MNGREGCRYLDVSARSEQGPVRAENQDAPVVDGWVSCAPTGDLSRRQIPLNRGYTCAVVDGMGGHVGGGVAAWLVARHLASGLGAVRTSDAADEFAVLGHELVGAAGVGLGMPEMGAAFAALTVDEIGFRVTNVGDCRVYRLGDGRLTLLTVDDVGPSRTDPEREVLTQSLGGGGRYRVDAHWFDSPWPPDGGDRFLLATDGLAVLDSPKIASLASTGSAEHATSALVDEVLQIGAPDNVTVIILDVHAVVDQTGDVRNVLD